MKGISKVLGIAVITVLLLTAAGWQTAQAAPPADPPAKVLAHHFLGNGLCQENYVLPEKVDNDEWFAGPCPPDDSCPDGQHLEGEECVDDPLECPDGQHLEGETCVDDTLECPDGQHQEGSGDGAICVDDPLECPDGQHLEDETCVPDDRDGGGGSPVAFFWSPSAFCNFSALDENQVTWNSRIPASAWITGPTIPDGINVSITGWQGLSNPNGWIGSTAGHAVFTGAHLWVKDVFGEVTKCETSITGANTLP